MNLASMTGFGRAQGPISDRLSASVVVRSVNHKFLDVLVRTNIREEVPELEAAVRGAVAARLERGKVSVQVDFERTAPQPSRVIVNVEALSSVVEQLDGLRIASRSDESVAIGELLAIPGMVAIETAAVRPLPEEADGLAELAGVAIDELVSMRRAEAEVLEAQIRGDLAIIESFVTWMEEQAPEFRSAGLDRLRARLKELLGSVTMIDDDRIVQEAAILADRSDVSEELVRLRSHLAGFSDRLAEGGAIGRSLDFLCQEILRELNTVGSKCRENGVADRLVVAKAAIERVREQVQNLE